MGKKYKHTFKDIVNHENLLNAYEHVFKLKRVTMEKLEFRENLHLEIDKLLKELEREVYVPGDFRTFTIKDPKVRTIKYLSFRDRIVEVAIYTVLMPIFEKTFYDNSYATRIGYGSHKCVLKMHEDMKSLFYPTSGIPGYQCLKIDYRKYFDSVDHTFLLKLIGAKIKCSKTMWLLRTLLNKHPDGIPIGSVLSQLYANIYGTFIDKFIKTELKPLFYYRYMDDLLIIDPDSIKLMKFKEEIIRVSRDYMKLTVGKWYITATNQHVDFIGYKVSHKSILLRKRKFFDHIKAMRRCKDENLEQLYAGLNGSMKILTTDYLRSRITFIKDSKAEYRDKYNIKYNMEKDNGKN